MLLLVGSQLVFQSTRTSVRCSDTERSVMDRPVVVGHRQVSPGSYQAKDDILFEAHNVSAGQAIIVGHREESTEAVEAKESSLVVAPMSRLDKKKVSAHVCSLRSFCWLYSGFENLSLRFGWVTNTRFTISIKNGCG
jgi:hypothetical protein